MRGIGLMFSLYMDNWCWSRRVRYQRAGLYCLPVRIYGDHYNWAYILQFWCERCCVLHTYSGADKVLRSDIDANCFDMRSGLWTFGFGGSLDCFYHAAVEFL